MHILLLKSEKVIGKLEDKTEVKIQEDRQSNIENTTLKELEQKHSKFKGNKKWNEPRNGKIWRKQSGAVRKSTT